MSFVDVAERAGLRGVSVYGGLDRKRFIIETNGAGVAFFDYDNDGWMDALVLSGTRLEEGARREKAWPAGAVPTSRLYRNNRDGTFTDATGRAGLRRTGFASSVCAGDYDNDGWLDVFITYFGGNVLYRNRGDGSFEDLTEGAGLAARGTRWGSGCAFVDYDRDGRLDLFVANYLSFDLASAPEPGKGPNCLWKGIPVNCGPKGLPFDTNLLYRNRGDGSFEDVSDRSGVSRVTGRYSMTATGADFDDDGWPDVYVACDSTAAILYRNNRDGTFTDVTEKAGLTLTGWASAVTVGDYDNDGFDDLFLTYYGHNVLYHNNGDGTFTDVTAKAGLGEEGVRYGSGCTWVDYDRDGRLDLFVAYYLETTLEKLPRPGENPDCRWKGVPVNCGPRGLPTGFARLYHNNGDGTFTDVSRPSGVAAASGSYPMTAVAADYDNDGWPDVYVAGDSTPSWLFRNQHDGTFRQEGLERGVALSEDGQEQAGMGVAVGDYDADGHLDVFKTHFSDDTNVLYRNDGKGYFNDVTIRAGLAVETRYVGWGAGMVDLDNDGWPDLFVVTGSVYPEVERTLPAYPFRTPRLVFRNLGDGRFEELIDEAGPGVAATHVGRGCAFGDFDNDGDVDVLVLNMNEPPSLLRNDVTGDGHWLKVLLEGVKSNRSAIGARVAVRYGEHTQAQEVLAQSSFYSASDRRLHFGLGPATTVDVTIRWPSGALEKVSGVAADHLVVVREGSGIVRKQSFTKRS